jgi:hypothetical protein
MTNNKGVLIQVSFTFWKLIHFILPCETVSIKCYCINWLNLKPFLALLPYTLVQTSFSLPLCKKSYTVPKIVIKCDTPYNNKRVHTQLNSLFLFSLCTWNISSHKHKFEPRLSLLPVVQKWTLSLSMWEVSTYHWWYMHHTLKTSIAA